MKITIEPTENIRTSVPISLAIEQAQGRPKAYLEGMGAIELKEQSSGQYSALFYTQLPGSYQLTVTDQQQEIKHELIIHQQKFLEFSQEFGFFTILFLIVITGVILWTKKIMQKS